MAKFSKFVGLLLLVVLSWWVGLNTYQNTNSAAAAEASVVVIENKVVETLLVIRYEYVPVLFCEAPRVSAVESILVLEEEPEGTPEPLLIPPVSTQATPVVTTTATPKPTLSTPTTTATPEPTVCVGNPGNIKCVGNAGEEPNGKEGWNNPPGTNGMSDGKDKKDKNNK